MSSAYAPFNVSIGNFQSYITVAEYLNAPTSIDTFNLLPQGSALSQEGALQEVIARASSWIDSFCTGNAYGTLCATVNVENARVWGSYRNSLIVHPLYFPILEVQSFSYSTLQSGISSGNAASIMPSGNITVYPQQFEVSIQGAIGIGLNAPFGVARGYEYVCQWQYINGWPNTTLSASVAAGATSITVESGLGIYPGAPYTLFDLPYDENVITSTSYTPDSNTIEFSSPLQYTHAAGAVITNLPKSVKQACILLTGALIKQRGSGALIVQDMGLNTKIDNGFPQGENADVQLAKSLLQPLRQMYIGY